MSGVLTPLRVIVFVLALLMAVLFVQAGVTAGGIAVVFGSASFAAQRVVSS